MWYNRPKQYLRKTFTQSGLGVLLMAKKPDNTLEAAQMDANGSLKVDATITAGDATAANQVTQITEAQTANGYLANVNEYLLNQEVSGTYTLTNTLASIGSANCYKVTIWLLSTATAPVQLEINPVGGGTEIIMEPGYSMEIQINQLDKIEAYQSGGEGDTLYFKYVAD